MKRFIKTYTVRRHVQFTVIQDGTAKRFSVQRWAADDTQGPEEIAHYTYTQGGADCDAARVAAMGEALRLSEAERLGRAVLHAAGEGGL